MRTLAILFRKELHATFISPIGYTVAAVFLLVLGYTFSLTLFATKVANLTYIFHQIYVLSILLVPALTMRAFAEERRTDTLELLLTAPVREVWVVLAKFLASLTLVLGMTDTPALRTLLAENHLPVPDNIASPEAVARVGLARLPHGPVHNWGLEDDQCGFAPMSAGVRRARVLAIDESSKRVFERR